MQSTVGISPVKITVQFHKRRTAMISFSVTDLERRLAELKQSETRSGNALLLDQLTVQQDKNQQALLRLQQQTVAISQAGSVSPNVNFIVDGTYHFVFFIVSCLVSSVTETLVM